MSRPEAGIKSDSESESEPAAASGLKPGSEPESASESKSENLGIRLRQPRKCLAEHDATRVKGKRTVLFRASQNQRRYASAPGRCSPPFPISIAEQRAFPKNPHRHPLRTCRAFRACSAWSNGFSGESALPRPVTAHAAHAATDLPPATLSPTQKKNLRRVSARRFPARAPRPPIASFPDRTQKGHSWKSVANRRRRPPNTMKTFLHNLTHTTPARSILSRSQGEICAGPPEKRAVRKRQLPRTPLPFRGGNGRKRGVDIGGPKNPFFPLRALKRPTRLSRSDACPHTKGSSGRLRHPQERTGRAVHSPRRRKRNPMTQC
jgi:hypothetical protein